MKKKDYKNLEKELSQLINDYFPKEKFLVEVKNTGKIKDLSKNIPIETKINGQLILKGEFYTANFYTLIQEKLKSDQENYNQLFDLAEEINEYQNYFKETYEVDISTDLIERLEHCISEKALIENTKIKTYYVAKHIQYLLCLILNLFINEMDYLPNRVFLLNYFVREISDQFDVSINNIGITKVIEVEPQYERPYVDEIDKNIVALFRKALLERLNARERGGSKKELDDYDIYFLINDFKRIKVALKAINKKIKIESSPPMQELIEDIKQTLGLNVNKPTNYGITACEYIKIKNKYKISPKRLYERINEVEKNPPNLSYI